MKVGIIGLPGSGKTTLFGALTRGTVKVEIGGMSSGKSHVGVVHVPDSRIDYFSAQYHPKKITYASIEFVDGAAKLSGEDGRTKFGSDFFIDVRMVDALVHVVRGFPDITGEPATPAADAQTMSDELLIADLQLVENRMQRVEKQLHGVKKGATTPATMEMDLLQRLKDVLESGGSLKDLDLGDEEQKTVRSYDFLTLKPVVTVLNISEDMLGKDVFAAWNLGPAIFNLVLCASVEMEVSQLSDEDEAEFLQSMGIAEPARSALIRECYRLLGLISFITAGEPEVRAWTLRQGGKSVEAAGTIHSDLARGFIRIEVANFAEIEKAGSWEDAKAQGIVQLHGKEYVMQDGDVVYIRFKV